MNIKNWWENLLDRERQLLSMGGVVLAILFIYVAIWSPLSDAVLDRETQVNSQQQLLQYLKQVSVTIQQLKAAGISVQTGQHTDLLSSAEQTLSQQQLSTYLKQVQQPQQNQIALTFEKVPFDKLMQWLQTFSIAQGVHVTQLSATRLVVVGTANVKMVLTVVMK